MSVYEIAGLFGVAFYIGSYGILQAGFIKGDGYLYPTLNAVAAGLVFVSLFKDFNLSSAIIQSSWIVISLIGISRLYYIRNSMRLSERERHFIEMKIPGLPNDLARRLFKNGEWVTIKNREQIIVEGQSTDFLIYIHQGRCEIQANGKFIATCLEGDFVGEVTCFSGAPATATAIMQGPAQVFRIDVRHLRQIAPLGSSFRVILELAIGEDLRVKLARNNNQTNSTSKTPGTDLSALAN